MEIHPTHQGMGWDGEHKGKIRRNGCLLEQRKSLFSTEIKVQKQKSVFKW